LPVLVVAAAYQAARDYLKEPIRPLQSHHAADKQTGSLGDLEITLINEQMVATETSSETPYQVLTETDNGKTIERPKGQTLKVTLASNPTTGYSCNAIKLS